MSHHSPAAYAQAFIRAQKDKFDKEKEVLFDRLVAMMRSNDDEKKFFAILRIILRLLSEGKNQGSIRVVTSYEISAQEKSNFEKHFASHTYKWEVNPEILGGMVVERGTRLYQMSLRHFLKGFER